MTPQQTPPPDPDPIAAQIVGLYVLGEQQILDGVTRILRRTPATLEGRQAAVPKIRRLTRDVVNRLIYQTNRLLPQLVRAAVESGIWDAEREVERALTAAGGSGGSIGTEVSTLSDDEFFDLSLSHGERSAQAIRNDITSSLENVRFRITRLPEDIYKFIAPHGAIYQALENAITPDQAQAMAWRVFVSQGITGFTDKSGRDWSLSSYVEMAVRTATTRAYNASHLARMHALGIHYFSVTDDGHPCPFCFPWQGKTLTDGVIQEPETFVDATIAEATLAGLFHPNCRHTLVAFIPGISVRPEPVEWTPEMQQMYADTQKQRALELAVRKARRRLDYATNAETRKLALAEVRAALRKVREFVNAHPHLARQSRREQLDLRDPVIKLPAI
jgi:hypothetical protein